MRTKKAPFASGLSLAHISSLLHTMTGGVRRVCMGKGWQLSPKSRCCGHLSSSLSRPWRVSTWADWLLWENLLPVAPLHPLCASEKLRVRSAKTAYSTTVLSIGTAGLNPLTSFFRSSVICLCSNFHCFSRCYFPGWQHQIIPLCHRFVIGHLTGPECCLERKHKLLLWLRHLHIFCRSGEAAKKM